MDFGKQDKKSLLVKITIGCYNKFHKKCKKEKLFQGKVIERLLWQYFLGEMKEDKSKPEGK